MRFTNFQSRARSGGDRFWELPEEFVLASRRKADFVPRLVDSFGNHPVAPPPGPWIRLQNQITHPSSDSHTNPSSPKTASVSQWARIFQPNANRYLPMTENNKPSELLETSVVWVLSAVVAALGFLLVWLVLSLVGSGRA